MAERILVIEDDPSILRGLQLNLGMEGYVVRSAMDGETGLALARTEKPDLVVVDVMLPRLGGLEVVREIRAEDAELPVLILSAKGQELDKVKGLEFGADDYMVKPFGVEELLARVLRPPAAICPANGADDRDRERGERRGRGGDRVSYVYAGNSPTEPPTQSRSLF